MHYEYYYGDVDENEASQNFDEICEMVALMKNSENRARKALKEGDYDCYKLNCDIYNDSELYIFNLVEPYLDCIEENGAENA